MVSWPTLIKAIAHLINARDQVFVYQSLQKFSMEPPSSLGAFRLEQL